MTKPTLLEEVTAESRHHGPRCSVCTLPEKVRDEINEVMRAYRYAPKHKALERALLRRGVETNRQRLQHHYEMGHHDVKV